MASDRASRRAFFGVSALLFAASSAVTIVGCASMSAMGEVPMPGGWTMSMAWICCASPMAILLVAGVMEACGWLIDRFGAALEQAYRS